MTPKHLTKADRFFAALIMVPVGFTYLLSSEKRFKDAWSELWFMVKKGQVKFKVKY
jgi:hypothetical protein